MRLSLRLWFRANLIRSKGLSKPFAISGSRELRSGESSLADIGDPTIDCALYVVWLRWYQQDLTLSLLHG